jgi:HEAT repeat protein/energy-coupling factor transporter ATP-binding protein EcfA2
MQRFIETLLEQYKDNKLVIGLAGVILGAILTKFLPALWSALRTTVTWFGRKIGGRFAYSDFERNYLDWTVTEHRELKLTGIVTTDEAKKPKLEQVFVSLQIAKQRMADSVLDTEIGDLNLQGTIPTWGQLREILNLQAGLAKDRSEKKSIKTLIRNTIEFTIKSKITHLKALYNKVAHNLKVPVQFVVENNEAKRLKWIKTNKNAFHDSIGDFQLRNILKNQRRIAILGAPGSGKTTLLQYIALAHARERAADPKLHERGVLRKRLGIKKWRLPIFIRLSSIASMLLNNAENGRSPSLLDVLPRILPPDLQASEVASNYFTHQLRSGRCLILLDGLDEVPTDDEFQAVVRAIESFILTYSSNQFVITSRIAGWRSGVNADFEIYRVNDLTDRQVNTFIDTWYSAVERNNVVGRLQDEGKAERSARERRANQKANDLKSTLSENVGIRRLATNPMLLSIIALVHRSLATLPKERSKLYAQCSRILLEQWDISRGVRVDDTNLKLEQKEAIMRRLAIAFHTGEIGDSGGGREVSRSQVKQIIAEMLPSLGRPVEDASHLLQMLIERSGILIERRRDILSFGHHTFQEYFTAQYLATGEHQEHRNFLLRDENLMSDWWHEVILLYSGLLSDTSNFIKLIYDQTYDDICQRKLRLATLCLGEAVKVEQIDLRELIIQAVLKVRTSDNNVEPSLTSFPDVADYLIQWAKEQDWYTHAAMAKVRTTPDITQASPVYQAILAELDNPQSVIRKAVVECIPSLPHQILSKELESKIFALLKAEEVDIRVSVVRTLGLLTQMHWDQSRSQELLYMLRDKHREVRSTLLNVLIRMQHRIVVTEAALTMLDEMLRSEDWEIRQTGAFAFSVFQHQLGKDHVDTFIGLVNDENYYVRDAVEEILPFLSAPRVANALLSKAIELVNDYSRQKDKYLGLEIIHGLRMLSPPTFIIDKLFAMLDHKGTQSAAISALSRIAKHGSRDYIIKKILSLLESTNKSLQRNVIELIANSGDAIASEEIVDKLLKLSDTNSTKIRCATASALRVAATTDRRSIAIQKLIDLRGDTNIKVRAAAIQSLGLLSQPGIDEYSPEIILSALNDSSLTIQISAVEAVGSLSSKVGSDELAEKLIRIFNRVNSIRPTHFFSRWIIVLPQMIRGDFNRISYWESLIRVTKALIKFKEQRISQRAFERLLNLIRQEIVDPSDILFDILMERSVTRSFFNIPSDDTEKEITDLEYIISDSGNIKLTVKDEDRERVSFRTLSLIKLAQHSPITFVVNTLSSDLNSDKQPLQILALKILGALEWRTVEDYPKEQLSKALESREDSIRLAALYAVAAIGQGPARREILNMIVKKLRDTDKGIRDKAWEQVQQTT